MANTTQDNDKRANRITDEPITALLFGIVLWILLAGGVRAQSGGPRKGTLIVDGGGTTAAVVQEFIRVAGGDDANIVCIPTAASSIRFGPQNIILDVDARRDRPEWRAYRDHLKKWFATDAITLVHTRDRETADSESFAAPLRQATAVYLGPGNSGRLAAAYLDTRVQRELENVLSRGGVIFGSSAGAIVQGSFLVRGRPDKPLLMAAGHERGFGFLKNVAIDPHLTSAKRDAELVNVVDAHPELLGIGIDDDAALVVRGDTFEVIGTGRVAIYDNIRHGDSWYFWVRPGDRFDLAARQKVSK